MAVIESIAAAATPAAVELPTTASSYSFLGKIGQGAFASVWKAHCVAKDNSNNNFNNNNNNNNNNAAVYAVKVLNLDHIDSDLNEIRMEVQLMRLSLHPNILPCHTAFLAEGTQLWVVTPFMNKGSSTHCLAQARRNLLQKQQAAVTHVSLEPHILYILQQTLLGLQYIHDNGQIHRDIKGSNILLNGAGEVKIADFGVSGWLIPQNEKAKTFVGTPCWMAPGKRRTRIECMMCVMCDVGSVLCWFVCVWGVSE